jgi:hypothetical protein
MLKMVSCLKSPENCTAVMSVVSGTLIIFQVLVEIVKLIHITDHTVSWSMKWEEGLMDTKWFRVLMLVKKVMLGP